MADFPLRADFARFNPINPVERAAIEAEIEALIALLDLADGDADVEDVDDDAEDDPLDHAELDDADEYNLLPLYGVDQSLGPINEIEESQFRMTAIHCEWSWGAPRPAWRYRYPD